jgi:lipopolysaccharide export system permease protein
MQLAVSVLPRVLYRGIPWSVVAELFAVNMASIIVLAIPMALLVASLMTFGKFSADNEIVAIKAAGKGVMDLVPPIISLSAVIAVILLFFNNNILPDANHHASQLMSDIMRKKPAAMIEPGLLIKDFPGYALMVDSVENSTGKLFDIVIFSDEKSGNPTLTVADSGTIFMTPDESQLELTLFDGEVHSGGDGKNSDYYRISFSQQVLFVENSDSDLKRNDTKRRGDRDKSSADLLKDVDDIRGSISKVEDKHDGRIAALVKRVKSADSAKAIEEPFFKNFDEWIETVERKSTREIHYALKREKDLVKMRSERISRHERNIDKNMVEVHKKYAISVAAIIFALLGVPLGIIAKNGSVAISASYSISFFIIYYAFLIAGEHLSDNGVVPPAVSMWIGNVLLSILAIYLLRRAVKEKAFINWKLTWDIIKFPFKTVLKFVPAHRKRRVRPLSILQKIFGLPSALLKKVFPILPSYILGRFIAYFFTITIGLIVLTVVIDYVSGIRGFDGATIRELLIYYLYFMGWFLSIILPIALLLASMMSIGSFAKTNEITAIKAAGISMIRVTIPLIIIGILFSGFSFWFSELVLPEANRQREMLKETFKARRNNRPIPTVKKKYKRNFYYFGVDNTIYRFGHFQTEPPRGENLIRYKFEDNRVTSVLDARRIKYEEERWIIYDGHERTFSKEGYSTRDFEKERDRELVAVAPDMVKSVRFVDQLSYGELKEFMEVVKRRGEKTARYEADLNFKFALPLMNLVVILVGVAVTARSDRRGGAVYFGVGIGLVFLYWGLAQFLLIFGRDGQLSPLFSAWSATIFFLILGIYLYQKASK